MKHNFKLLFAVSLLIFVSLACSTDILPGESDATSTDKMVLFQDDFSDPTSGWDQVSNEEGITDYESGTYRILVNVSQIDYWANPGLNFGDVVVEVDTTKAGGPDDNDFGVICRYLDEDNFYFFLISSDGYYAIGKTTNGEQVLLQPAGQMQPSEAVFTEKAENHLRAECVGSHLTLVVNGNLVAETDDSSFSNGDVGLMAGAFDESGVDIRFDNFTVKEP